MLATYLMFWISLPVLWALMRFLRPHPRGRRVVQAVAAAWGLYGLMIALLRQLASTTNTDLVNTAGLVVPSALVLILAVWDALAQRLRSASAESVATAPGGLAGSASSTSPGAWRAGDAADRNASAGSASSQAQGASPDATTAPRSPRPPTSD